MCSSRPGAHPKTTAATHTHRRGQVQIEDGFAPARRKHAHRIAPCRRKCARCSCLSLLPDRNRVWPNNIPLQRTCSHFYCTRFASSFSLRFYIAPVQRGAAIRLTCSQPSFTSPAWMHPNRLVFRQGVVHPACQVARQDGLYVCLPPVFLHSRHAEVASSAGFLVHFCWMRAVPFWSLVQAKQNREASHATGPRAFRVTLAQRVGLA